jgi:hypothetical protein
MTFRPSELRMELAVMMSRPRIKLTWVLSGEQAGVSQARGGRRELGGQALGEERTRDKR